ncbi:MAG TPA: hypothetical protein VMS76_07570 [Planctomycetota bacterium]|nr:hypothetical protein [Planctomycetota bacterium]
MSKSIVRATLGVAGLIVLGGLAQAQNAPRPQSYCLTSPNSIGSGATMGWFGSVQIGVNDFTLLVNEAVPESKGLFLYGMDVQRLPFGNGYLCIAPPVHRLPGLLTVSDAGDAMYRIDLGIDANAMFAAGTSWNFQFWYRDERTFNFSDGLNVVFAR